MRSPRPCTVVARLMLAVLLLAGCSGTPATAPISDTTATSTATTTPTAGLPAPVQLLLGSSPEAIGTDTVEVWVCEVPLNTTDPTFNVSTLRLGLNPAALAIVMNAQAAPYFSTLSHGAYLPTFVPGGIHQMTSAESPEQCVEAALNAAASTSNAVFAVGTAESAATTSGGFGTPGSSCSAGIGSCPAAESRRSAYVGASDFHPDWGPEPAMDLVEHEMGHMLGWPHSGVAGQGYASGLDVMSNSAAPRAFDAARRDAQDTLGVNRLAAGWIQPGDMLIVDGKAFTPKEVTLQPSTAADGRRLLILPVDDQRFLTVEYLSQTGLDEFLPMAGVTITLIDQSPGVCSNPGGSPCAAEHREQITQVGETPFYDLLAPGVPAWTGFGWTITVTSVGSTAQLTLGN